MLNYSSSPKVCPVCKAICNKNPKTCLAELKKKIRQDEIDAKKYGKLGANRDRYTSNLLFNMMFIY